MQWYSSPNLQNQTKDSNDKFSTKPKYILCKLTKPKIQNTCNSFFFTTAVFISKQNKK